jgi:hypothetical protein
LRLAELKLVDCSTAAQQPNNKSDLKSHQTDLFVFSRVGIASIAVCDLEIRGKPGIAVGRFF